MLIGFALFSVQATAGVIWNTPVGGISPFYWSGTNCRALASASVDRSSRGFKKAELFIDFQLVSTQSWSGSWLPPNVSASVMFDSTHFLSGLYVWVRFQVTDEANHVYYKDYGATVKNWCYFANDSNIYQVSGGQGSEAAYYEMVGIPHYLRFERHDSWNDDVYFTDIVGCNVVGPFVHGNWNFHKDGSNTHWIYLAPEPTYLDYLTQMQAIVGSGFPPVNSTHEPPINLLMLTTCLAGAGQMSNGLFPNRNAYNPQIENQAAVGYAAKIPLSEFERFAVELLHPLTLGKSLSTAKTEFLAAGLHIVNDDGSLALLQEIDINISGDLRLRLTTVYTGTVGPPAGWFRTL